MASRKSSDDLAQEIFDRVTSMSPTEVQKLIKERGLEHLADPGRLARMLDEPETGGTLH